MSSYYQPYMDMVVARDSVMSILSILAVAWVAGWWLLPRIVASPRMLRYARLAYAVMIQIAAILAAWQFVRISNG